ncbi:MAG: LuxR C-terminal-related transcriptional regulator, partial [Actinobacteria bacterium]|nr:LuxR C-terminal-related transcriptional regulator [Actinomycetota bacterium]
LWGADEALREAIGLPLSYLDRSHPDYESLLAAARSQLDEAAWEAAQAEGRAMTPEQAVEYALKVEEEKSASPSTTAPPPSYPAGLSVREAEVLKLVAKGLTDTQVAEELFISPRTVSGHLTSVYGKLGVSSRAAATRFAAEHDLL